MPKPTATAKKPAPKKAARKVKPTAAEPAAVELEVKLADLDLSPAEAVRSRATPDLSKELDDLVSQYAADDLADPTCLPPIAVFRGPNVLYVADGATRCEARRRNGRDSVRAKVWVNSTDAIALYFAREFAERANTTHGKGRREADTELAVWNAIQRADEQAGDREITRRTRAAESVVKRLREQWTAEKRLTGKRAASYGTGKRYKKENATVRHGYESDGKGGTVRKPTAASAGSERPEVLAASSPAAAGSSGSQPATGRQPLAASSSTPAPPAARDDKDKPVPERLVGHFAERHLITAVTQAIGGLDRAKALHGAPGFTTLTHKLNRLAGELNQIKPAFVCDRCEGAGEEAGDPCPACKGLGWGVNVTTGIYVDPVRVLPAVADIDPAAEAEPEAPVLPPDAGHDDPVAGDDLDDDFHQPTAAGHTRAAA